MGSRVVCEGSPYSEVDLLQTGKPQSSSCCAIQAAF